MDTFRTHSSMHRRRFLTSTAAVLGVPFLQAQDTPAKLELHVDPSRVLGPVSNDFLGFAFIEIADWPRAQGMANAWAAQRIHRKLDEFARGYCPVYRDFATGYHWSTDECEYATDIVFRKQADLPVIYENLARTEMLLCSIVRGEFSISGLQNKTLRPSCRS